MLGPYKLKSPVCVWLLAAMVTTLLLVIFWFDHRHTDSGDNFASSFPVLMGGQRRTSREQIKIINQNSLVGQGTTANATSGTGNELSAEINHSLMSPSWTEFYNLIEETTSFCELKKFGGFERTDMTGIDGTKLVCLDAGVAPEPGSCVVLSFGVNDEWSFDDAMEIISPLGIFGSLRICGEQPMFGF
ncbi:uncharacterized protein LOC108676882 [Hyalella azteca]|uniref:Uncharacterized protein LOC108676882 n=1 Tax=Hyalella azteca TaxID=294128 RepID=A0A8B7P608_HYAAZ|nr:uncharacterized protein LOC108676882 [Hyalella azteca]